MKLDTYQFDAMMQLRNGSVLCGGVGSGKSLTALAYYITQICLGSIRIIETDDDGTELPFAQYDCFQPMKKPRDLYIITTAKKRDSREWEDECAKCGLSTDPTLSHSGVKVTIDSWNNVKKYDKVYGAFFIFDEQRVVGSGAWVKEFLTITKKNQWILLSATPGDTWSDYIPVFVANGFYKNKTEFQNHHAVFARYSKYPKVERWIGEKELERLRDQILVPIKTPKRTTRLEIRLDCEYNKELYHMIFRERWNPFENCPIEETGKLMYLIRKVVNDDPSRLERLREVIEAFPRVIVFYNFNYELDAMVDMIQESYDRVIAQWNGHCHENVPKAERWVYLVQYSAGCEGWNCIDTNIMVFYSQQYSYRMLEQAMGRIDRRNTPFVDLVYYHLVSKAPIDRAIWEALRRKQNFNEKGFIGKSRDRFFEVVGKEG